MRVASSRVHKASGDCSESVRWPPVAVAEGLVPRAPQFLSVGSREAAQVDVELAQLTLRCLEQAPKSPLHLLQGVETNLAL